jgi:tRNA modification GTPase
MPQTIIALATPPGRSGIGVIRLSGGDALTIIKLLVRPQGFDPEPRLASLKQLYDLSGELIDEAIVIYFKAPNSFTGEHVIEIGCHGSPVVLRQVIDLCLEYGARLADPGEFTLRALANGRIDLAEAEAIRDLIDAQTGASARQAVRQMRGELSGQLKPLKDDLVHAIVILESALEFVEDDLPATQASDVQRRLLAVSDQLNKMASTFAAGRLIREGLKVALVGRPNVGKSSLFNALLGSERAIVTPIAGTTRDQLYERLNVDGIPVSLIDTAGIRETVDIVESIGVDRSRAVMADADVVIVMIDAADPLTNEDLGILADVTDIDHLIVVNKIDKVETGDLDLIRSQLGAEGRRVVPVSAINGTGLDELQAAIVGPFNSHEIWMGGFLVTDARHHDLLQRAAEDVRASLEQFKSKMSEEIVLIGLHNALRYLGEITGQTTTEEMLAQIFATFCIGK